jgi:signal transduction histidine kinase
VSIRHAPGRGIPAVRVDRVQLQQVILNLVMNALEAMVLPKGVPRRLDVGVCRQVGNDAVQVDVRDTGVGIAPSDRDCIFDAFHTTKPEGMGMGLAICRSIVEAHGGRLWATPNEDSGETFHFTLPAADA